MVLLCQLGTLGPSSQLKYRWDYLVIEELLMIFIQDRTLVFVLHLDVMSDARKIRTRDHTLSKRVRGPACLPLSNLWHIDSMQIVVFLHELLESVLSDHANLLCFKLLCQWLVSE
jgi:hypothetical protein